MSDALVVCRTESTFEAAWSRFKDAQESFVLSLIQLCIKTVEKLAFRNNKFDGLKGAGLRFENCPGKVSQPLCYFKVFAVAFKCLIVIFAVVVDCLCKGY